MAEGMLSRWLSTPGLAQGLLNMGAAFMAGGAPTADPGASSRAWGQGAQAFGAGTDAARQQQIEQQYRQAQLAKLEQDAKDKQAQQARQEALQRSLLGSYMGGSGPAAKSPRAAQEAGLTQPGILSGIEGPAGEMVRALATVEPEKALASGIALTKPKEASSTRYSALGAYVDQNGEFVGEGYFDRGTGQSFMRDRTGKEIPIPPGAQPRTEGALDKNTYSGKDFAALASEANETERSLRAIKRYVANVKDTEQGYGLIADQLAGQFKTIFGGELTPQQYRTMMQTGQLQGLLGGFRKEVVGGGVMTEQDALRVLARLGGDVSLLRNRDVAVNLIKEIMEEKVAYYNEVVVPTYNQQLKQTPRGKGFSPKMNIAIDPKVFERSKPGANAPTTGAPGSGGWVTLPNGVRIREKP